MEQYYYNHMNKPQQAAYHSIFVGVKNLSDEIQVPALSGEELYNIFFQMRLDHPEIFWVTNFKYRYYKEKKLSFTKQEDVYKRSLQAAKKEKVLVFHWRGGYLTKEVLNELLDLIRKAGMEKEKTAMVSINWPQAVLRVQYADIQVQESVMLEEANEGEKD